MTSAASSELKKRILFLKKKNNSKISKNEF